MTKFIKRDTNWEKLAKEAYKVQKKRKELEEQEKELLNHLKEVSDYQSAQGKSFKFQLIERRPGVKYGLIPELKYIDLDKYRPEGVLQSWKLFKY